MLVNFIYPLQIFADCNELNILKKDTNIIFKSDEETSLRKVLQKIDYSNPIQIMDLEFQFHSEVENSVIELKLFQRTDENTRAWNLEL